MSDHHHNLRHRTEQEQTAAADQRSNHAGDLEFATAEEALRHDAEATPLPPAIAERLQKSIQAEPAPPPRTWWQRLLRR